MRRVVITGMGTLNPLGIGKQDTWKAICEGRSGIDYITRFDVSSYRSQIAGEVKGLMCSTRVLMNAKPSNEWSSLFSSQIVVSMFRIEQV